MLDWNVKKNSVYIDTANLHNDIFKFSLISTFKSIDAVMQILKSLFITQYK